MFLGKVIGSVVCGTRHPSYDGTKLMLVRPTDTAGNLEQKGTMVAVDAVGSGVGDWVLVASEGLACSEILNLPVRIPIREIVVAVVDRVDLKR
jgi:microcompartment protein CcmK/EutM